MTKNVDFSEYISGEELDRRIEKHILAETENLRKDLRETKNKIYNINNIINV